jgi:hypothetical protein
MIEGCPVEYGELMIAPVLNSIAFTRVYAAWP